MLKTLTIAATALLMASAPALATACKDYPIVTPDNAARPYSAIVKAGSATSNGYSGIPGEFGCPIKAAVGTCPDRNASLSNKVDSYLGQYVAYDGKVDDIERHKLGIKLGNTFIPLTNYIPGSCDD